MSDERRPAPVDWLALARKLQAAEAELIHRDDVQRYGDEFYAEALRRTFGYETNDEDGRRKLPYDSVGTSTGLTTKAESDHLRDSHTVVDRLNAERARAEVAEMRAEVQRVYREARADIAKALRERCNERTVPARFRREGVLLAADWIDGKPREEQ